MRRRGRVGAWLPLALAASACDRNEAEDIVRAASLADDAWTCPADSTRVVEIGGGRFRLSGCTRVVIYECTARPPTCQRGNH